eukprot:TRINITY_DN4080_c0_g5_i3.p11 TRINITY_DN4080_c0_g5~~TRINITY_DN4080_c0_g5_i3.p11  ORF type:complete len:108 (-),score=4.31 TRINITY_DN4080_c0_g5_i3:905-1228(-)
MARLYNFYAFKIIQISAQFWDTQTHIKILNVQSCVQIGQLVNSKKQLMIFFIEEVGGQLAPPKTAYLSPNQIHELHQCAINVSGNDNESSNLTFNQSNFNVSYKQKT